MYSNQLIGGTNFPDCFPILESLWVHPYILQQCKHNSVSSRKWFRGMKSKLRNELPCVHNTSFGGGGSINIVSYPVVPCTAVLYVTTPTWPPQGTVPPCDPASYLAATLGRLGWALALAPLQYGQSTVTMHLLYVYNVIYCVQRNICITSHWGVCSVPVKGW